MPFLELALTNNPTDSFARINETYTIISSLGPIPPSCLLQSDKDGYLIFLGRITLGMLIVFWQNYFNRSDKFLLRPKNKIIASIYDFAKPRIIKLKELIKLSSNKPPISSLRPKHWFSLGDEIAYCADIVSPDERRIKYKWYFGKVKRKFPYGNVEIDFENRGVVCDRSIAIVDTGLMHLWEYRYLISNPDFMKIWLNDSCRNDFLLTEIKKDKIEKYLNSYRSNFTFNRYFVRS